MNEASRPKRENHVRGEKIRMLAFSFQWHRTPDMLERALELTRQAVALDDSLALAHMMLGQVSVFQKRYADSLTEIERAITLSPNYAEAYARLGSVYVYDGRPEAAIQHIQQAMRLSPHYPPFYLVLLGLAYYLTDQAEKAIAVNKKILSQHGVVCPRYRLSSRMGQETA